MKTMTFGDIADSHSSHQAWVLGQPIDFDYKSHRSSFQKLWKHSLALEPPLDYPELLRKINQDPVFKPLRDRVKQARMDRFIELGSLPSDSTRRPSHTLDFH